MIIIIIVDRECKRIFLKCEMLNHFYRNESKTSPEINSDYSHVHKQGI